MVLEKTLESPLDCKEIQAVYPKGNQLGHPLGDTPSDIPRQLLAHEPVEEDWNSHLDCEASMGHRRGTSVA